jgi:hypothetical protein
MTRPSLLDYCGAGARLTPERGTALPHTAWAWQPKIDGVYARVTLDARGRVQRVLSRAGEPLRDAADLVGILAGPPDSVLHGELEAHTEAGIRAATTRGWAALHLYDVTRLDGRPLDREPYRARYAALHQAQAQLEDAGAARRHDWTDDATGRHHGASGRFVAAIPRDLRRFPVVPMARGKGAGEALWRAHVEVGGGEGIVAVRLDAPAKARGSQAQGQGDRHARRGVRLVVPGRLDAALCRPDVRRRDRVRGGRRRRGGARRVVRGGAGAAVRARGAAA